MSTSGTTTYNLVASEIMDEAFDLCGVGAEGEPVSADMYARAFRSLNMLLKALGSHEHLWLETPQTVTLVAAQAAYVLSGKPLKARDVRRKVTSGGIETPLMTWPRSTYEEQPNKTTASIPTAYFFDAQRTTATLYLWPVPSTATASAMTVELIVRRKIEDIVTAGNDVDLPQEWLLALSYMLAEQLALKYGVAPDIRSEIAQRAAAYKADMEAFDTEDASLFMQPLYR